MAATTKFALWIRFEDKKQSVEFQGQYEENELFHLDRFADLIRQREPLKKLNLFQYDLVFFGSYDHMNYPGDNNDEGKPLRRDILLSDLKTSATDPLIIRFPLSENKVIVNLEVPVYSQIHKFMVDHSTGTWFMLFAKIEKHAPELEGLDIYFRNKETESLIDNEFDLNDFLVKIEPNNKKLIVANLVVLVKVKSPIEEYEELIGDRDNLVFTVEKFNSFKFSDLRLPENAIAIAEDISIVESIDESDPLFVQEFVEYLRQKRSINPGENEYLPLLKDRMKQGNALSFSDYFEDTLDETACDVNKNELAAYVAVYDTFSPTASLVAEKSSFFMDGRFTTFLVDPVFIREKYDKGIGWAPTLLVKESDSDKVVKYSPKSDFFIGSSYGPLLVGETISDKKYESDRYRMLLQASVICRIINTTRKNDKSFVLLCYYINNKYHAERYIVYQPNDMEERTVQIKLDHLVDLAKPDEAFDLLFQLFNLRKLLPELESNFDEKKTEVIARVDTLTKSFYELSLSSQKSRSQRDSQEDSGQLTAILEHITTLTTYGYVIKEILHRPDVAIGIGTKTQTAVVIKCVNKQSDELLIMQYLNSAELQSNRNHTIPLLDIISLDKDVSAMVMHDCRPLSVLAYKSNGSLGFVNLTEAQCISLVKQLLEGVGFLHEHNIAHLDIKFSNLVIDYQSNKLLIIDYGLAKQLKSKETMLAGYRGTEGYVAPEVGDDEPFNPIRADLWSTGTVIHELLNIYSSREARMKLEYLNAIARKLTDLNPAVRPSASEAMVMLEQAEQFDAEKEAMPKFARINKLRDSRVMVKDIRKYRI